MFKRIMKSARKVADKVAAPAGRGLMGKVVSAVADKAMANKPKELAGKGIGKAMSKIARMKFKDGGMADKTGRAMKKTDADAKGRAMTKAPKKMMGGGMMKGYAEGGDVTCGKATRGYGAARKGK